MDRRQLTRDGAERMGGIEALADLSLGQRRMLAGFADEATAAEGEVIVEQGDPGYEFIMIEDGTAEVVQNGKRINTMGPGDSFGELAVLDDGAPRTATVIATSELRTIVLTAQSMRQMRERMPDVGERIDRIATERRERDLREAGAASS
jgi:CRP/FNR family transcriptional regulator, cyclic AMP receptor protein